ncbi:MAG: YpmA family protein [Bacillota bacterium]
MKAEESPQLTLIAKRSFKEWAEFYQVVDFLNKALKSRRLLFGLTKDTEKGEMALAIYEM